MAQRADVGPLSIDGKTAEPTQNVIEHPVGKQLFFGHDVHLSRRVSPYDDRVVVARMVHGENTPAVGNVLDAFNVNAKSNM